MVRIVIAGDYCPQGRVAKLIDEDKGETVLHEMKPYLCEADYSIVNFECAVADNSDKPIVKYGPCLSCSDKGVGLLKTIGFNCVTLANNHFRDFGDTGVNKTISALESYRIDYVGGGLNIDEAERVLYKVIKDRTIAFVNFCENEFSIATKDKGGAAGMNDVTNYYQITEAKANADYVIVIVHGGHEGNQYPSPRMRQLYKWYVDLGADIVVNGHQHCFSGFEKYKSSTIVYGLGNFCFDEEGSRDGLWNYGYFVCLNIDSQGVVVECVPYEQCNATPIVRLLKGKELGNFHMELSMINSVLCDKDAYDAQTKAYLETRRGYLSCVSPYMNEYIRAAAGKGWIPYLLPKKKLLTILNFIECESHRDLLVNSIKKYLFHE